MKLETFEEWAASLGSASHGGYRPRFIRGGARSHESLRRAGERAGIVAVDTLDRQLRELARIRFPAAAGDAVDRWVGERIAGYDGVWVHLPWARTIARLLEPGDYFEVTTNRNRDKITFAEQSRLRNKRVGVIGLSVGGEAATTLAQEHLCGHLVLADFDRLDLSNLNRLNAGFDEIGENKAVLVARRIARIDPYLDVTVYEDGVREHNVEDFLDGLDLLVEECDDLPLKFAIREEAKRRGIDVVFAGDERGFLSIEPHGTFPDLPLFHGRIASPPPPKNGFASAREFWKTLTVWLGGWDRISERSRTSLDQIGETLVGYPQLASEARFAAGQVGHAVRRMLLGETLPPFVGHVDLDEILPGS